MSDINFKNDIFIPTSLPEICAPRHELINRYYRAAQNHLVFVCAPAGHGKTVSTLLWVKDSGRRLVWIGLDEYDNAPFVFYKMFCTGIMSVQPDNINMEKILKSQAFYSSPVEHTINFLMEFAPDEQSYALILDDLHTITNKVILKSLAYILKRMPHCFDILLLSRGSLPEELSDFFESRNGAVITANELDFSAEEIQKYFCALGRKISNAQAQAIFDTTGGWAIGINLLSISEHFEVMQSGRPVLENYINKNIWEKWGKNLRDFMLVTSVANEMDAELCNILTDKKDADELLDRLVAQNLFVVKTSQSTYRYHHLFLEFLRNKVKESPDINVPKLILKVADLYFERQDFFTALAYYVRAENHSGINSCFRKLNSGDLDFNAEEWLNYYTDFVFNKLPEKFITTNIALVFEAVWINYLNGNAEAALRYIDIAYDYIASEPNLNLIKENDFLGSVCTLRFLDFRKGICEYTREISEWIKALPNQDHMDINIYAATITQNFPFMHRSVCDCLEIVVDMDNRLQTVKDVFGALFPKECNVLYYGVKAGLYYELNKLEQAHETIILAQCELKNDIRFEIRFCVYMLLSQILYALKEKEEAKSIKEHFAGCIREENALYLNPNFLAFETKHRLWDADRETAKKWLKQLFITEDEQLCFYKLYQYFTTARAYIVLSEKEKAMEYLGKLKKLSIDYRRPLDTAETGVLQASLKWATGSKKEAVQMLEEVLLAMQPYSAVRIIADEGAAVLPILKKIAANANRDDYEGLLDSHYLKQVLLCAYEVSKEHKGITAYFKKPVKLSKQQEYILTLLAQGYKNAEIMGITGLTINTIKAHTKAIYLKLNVNKAADAVIEAKKQGIIKS